MEKNLKIFQMKSKAYNDSLTKNNTCFHKFYSMWVLIGMLYKNIFPWPEGEKSSQTYLIPTFIIKF